MYSHFGHSIKKKGKRKTVVRDFLRKYKPCSLEREANSLLKREIEFRITETHCIFLIFFVREIDVYLTLALVGIYTWRALLHLCFSSGNKKQVSRFYPPKKKQVSKVKFFFVFFFLLYGLNFRMEPNPSLQLNERMLTQSPLISKGAILFNFNFLFPFFLNQEAFNLR